MDPTGERCSMRLRKFTAALWGGGQTGGWFVLDEVFGGRWGHGCCSAVTGCGSGRFFFPVVWVSDAFPVVVWLGCVGCFKGRGPLGFGITMFGDLLKERPGCDYFNEH
jgi:hypothetical protein